MPHHYQSVDAVLARVAAHAITVSLPPWPEVTSDANGHIQQWRHWLEQIWKQESIAEAIEVASPILARRVQSVFCERADLPTRDMRRMVLSVARYVLRMTGRATPFGMFAGVAPVRFGNTSDARWSGQQRVVARTDAVWLAAVLGRLEIHPGLLHRLSVVANNTCTTRGDRLVVLCQETSSKPPGVVSEVSVRATRPVETAMAEARSSIRFTDLVGALTTQFGQTPQLTERMLTELVSLGVLLTNLRPPMTVIDALAYVIDQLSAMDADEIPELSGQIQELRAIQSDINRHNSTRSSFTRHELRTDAARRMSTLCDTTERPLIVDLHVDGRLVLSDKIEREAEQAASALLRLTPRPLGAPAWQAYHSRFLDRYGVGALVPVLDLVNEATGLGFPAGYRGSQMKSSPASLTIRDLRLLKLAQQAVLDGSQELILNDRTINEISADEQMVALMPPHLELCCQIYAPTRQALDLGDFQLNIISASRAATTTTGRFLHLLDTSDRDRMIKVYAGLPTAHARAWPVQISCPPLSRRSDNVARVSAILPDIASLGEYRSPDSGSVTLEDLVVGSDAQRLYLMSLTRRRIVEPTIPHAVEFRNHTHPLARFLCEITIAQAAACLPFSWGAASMLPFLPRVRYGRTILASARWNLDASDMSPPGISWPQWNQAFSQLRHRLRIPDVVVLGEDDRRIRLEMNVPLHCELLRSHLERTGHAILHEAADPGAFGWCDGRPHEVVLPLARTAPAARPSRHARVLRTVGLDHGHLPGASEWLSAKLYGSRNRQAAVITTHLPDLLEMWDDLPEWWYVRYDDPEPHLRLRLRLSGSDARAFGDAVQRVGTWASGLRRAGLVARLELDTYFPETGRFGTGTTMEAAESVFAADSTAAVEELRCAGKGTAHLQALVGVSLVDIAIGFHGSISQGMSWLISEVKRTRPSSPPSRESQGHALRLAGLHEDGFAFRATPGSGLIEAAWLRRREKLARYRDRIAMMGDVEPASVLPALLHMHHLRVVGGDPDSEQICQRLARAVALSWRARTGRTAS